MDKHSVDWRGYIPAITTPFTEQGELDVAGIEKLLSWLHEERMHGILVAGTQGEWFSLSAAERKRLFEIVGSHLRGRMTLLAGCNAFNAEGAIESSRLAAAAGFDGIIVTPPPYMVPTEEEILGFYQDVNAGTALPICAYNWPPGTNVDMSLPLLRSIAQLSNVVAIKHSTGNLRHFLDVFFALKDEVRVFGVPMNAFGVTLVQHHEAVGTMGAGAVLGRELPDYFNAVWEGDIARAVRIGDRNDLLMRAWFNEDYTGRFGSSQAIFKAALNVQGLPGGYPRRPLLPLGESGIRSVRETLKKLGRV